MVSSYCRELCGPFPSPILMIGEENQSEITWIELGAKTWLKSCISKPVFLTAQQNSANTLHRQLEEEEGFGTDSRLQVLGWKRLDKILHCKQYNNCPSCRQQCLWHALVLTTAVYWLLNRNALITSSMEVQPGMLASARRSGKTLTNWVGPSIGN